MDGYDTDLEYVHTARYVCRVWLAMVGAKFSLDSNSVTGMYVEMHTMV